MSEFTDEYTRQILDNIGSIHDALFPKHLMARMDEKARAGIAAGTNVCEIHAQRRTTLMVYPDSAWCCDECAQVMFRSGMIGANGLGVFDMTDRPEGWTP